MRIAIADNGIGNLGNLANYVERNFGAKPLIASNPMDMATADLLILPGVGNFSALIRRIEGLREAIESLTARGGYVLGVCLGMQILFEESDEGSGKGLGVLQGRVVRIPSETGLRIPRIGWAPLRIKNPLEPWTRLEGLDFYYAHSYYAKSTDSVVGVSYYGSLEIPSLVVKGNIVATQFHPERSGVSGRVFAEALLSYMRG
ncbi:MAG: imidazole glycerol phosphate synthase subunit HisH [Sulfolobales archaeon]